MRRLSVAWPQLLGVTVAFTSLGLIMWQIEFWWWRYGVVHGSIEFLGWLLLFAPIFLLFLSYPLYHARDWARRAVIVMGLCVIVFALFGFGIRAVAESRIYDARVITFEMRIQQVLRFIGEVGVALSVLAPHVFVVAALCHRDVAATFHGEITERPNA
jgi:hypothetical protein